MRFTHIEKGGSFDTYSEALEKTNESIGLIPVLTTKEYSQMSSDYKGNVDGKPYILYLTEHGTTYGPCLINKPLEGNND